MPTLDVRERTLANPNDASTTVQGLTVNYSSLFPLTPEQGRRLALAFEIARRAVGVADDSVATLLTGLQAPARGGPGSAASGLAGAVEPLLADALRAHFKFRALDAPADQPPLPSSSRQAWAIDLGVIASTLRTLNAGLRGPTTISDAKSRPLRQYVEKSKATNPNIQQSTNADVVRLAVGTFGEKGVPLLQQAVRRLRDGEGMAGYVRLRKGVKDRMVSEGTWDAWQAKSPLVRVEATDRASIHIDFDFLDARPILFIAGMIIHEASHRYCSTRDFAYAGNPAYDTMRTPEALRNADSYAYFVLSLYKSHVFAGPDAVVGAATHGIDVNA